MILENQVQIEIHKKEISEIEKTIELEFNNLCKADSISYNRNNDWGYTQFGLVVVFDEINLNRIDEIFTKIKQLATQRKILRTSINKLEQNINIDNVIDRGKTI